MDACLDIAKALTKMTPDRCFGWVHFAMSLRKLNRVVEVRDALLSVLDRFEPHTIFPYYLACYWANQGEPGRSGRREGVVGESLRRCQEQDEAGKITLRQSNG